MSNDSDDHPSEYSNSHRAFLQALLARQTITHEQAKPILAAIQTAATPDRPTVPEDVTREDFEAYIHTLNAHISSFDFEVRGTLHQVSRNRVYALVNSASDALTQMATMHSADEIAFAKRVLDAMFETNNTQRAEVMAVRASEALKLVKAPQNESSSRRESGGVGSTQASASSTLTVAQAEKVLGDLVAEGWFEQSRMGFYSLTPRALMELRGWLMDAYNEGDGDDEDEESHVKIKFCQGCRDIVTVGQRCPRLTCAARLHNHCVRNKFRAQGGQEKCPLCKTAWVDAPPVGEDAAREGARRRGNANSGRRRSNGIGSRRAPQENGFEEDDDEESD